MIEALHYLGAALLAAVCGVWIFLIYSMARTFRRSPVMRGGMAGPAPRVSVIVPARNEEGYVGACLSSLRGQDYPDYEVVCIDDSSQDGTGRIMAGHAAESERIVHVSAEPKPDGWMGKNWACSQGYARATGSLLLFTDSDTRHAPGAISSAVSELLSQDLDALTGIPRIRAPEFWTRVTLPVISVFLDTRFSALRVNDPSTKVGYFFGSFFIIKRETYESVGTHEGVRHEIVEDGALGAKVKAAGHRMRMARAEHLVDAVWARDGGTLWEGMKRLMVPLYVQDPKLASAILGAVCALLFAPFAVLPYAIWAPGAPGAALLAASASASALVYAGTFMEAAHLKSGLRHAALAPLGALVVVAGFAAGILRARGRDSVSWRGRRYTVRDHAQRPVSL